MKTDIKGITLEKIDTEREVNFIVCDNGNYLFRLVPYEDGFDVSPLDKALGLQIDTHLIIKLGAFIENKFS